MVCTHFIVGRDHAGPGKDTDGKPFYGPYEAQEVFKKHEADIGVTMVPFNMMVYLEDQDKYFPTDEVPKGARVAGHLRHRTAPAAERRPRTFPAWFTYPEVVQELRRSLSAAAQAGRDHFLHRACQAPANRPSRTSC
jgi:sulfate adenylyltransferase